MARRADPRMGSTKLNEQLVLPLVKVCSNQHYWLKERAGTATESEGDRKKEKKLVLCPHAHIQHRKGLQRMEKGKPLSVGGI